MQRILGLDLGPNSIGWALIEDNNEGGGKIVGLGVRIFPEGVDAFDTSKEVSRNEQRRAARLMRRQIRRRSERQTNLRNSLVSANLWPSDADEQTRLICELDPFELRARAVADNSMPLTAFEIGRVFLHLNQRRGFWSPRKADSSKTKEEKGMLAEISELAANLGDATLGEFLNEKHQSLNHAHRKDDDHVRNRHTRRGMISEEFDQIWNVQSKYHPNVLTNRLRYGEFGKREYPARPEVSDQEKSLLEQFGIEGLIFFQRPIYWPRSTIGQCELLPRKKRCPRADRLAQRFRLLQEVNNLRYIDPDNNEITKLDSEQRAALIDYLSTRKVGKFDQFRKLLGFTDSVQFNLERGKRSKLQGMITDYEIAKTVGKSWHKKSDQEKSTIVRSLLNVSIERDVEARLINEFGYSAAEAEALLSTQLPDGYVHLSREALERIIPPMEEGLVYQHEDDAKSAIAQAGFLRRDQLERYLFDRLPTKRFAPDGVLGEIPNPVVKRALVELRKVVNSIINTYGKPDEIHVEMAREVKQGSEARGKYNSMIREREKKRDEAAEAIRAMKDHHRKIIVNRESIQLYRLWKDQNHNCIYCGNKISQSQLFGGDIDVDHILPRSRTIDNSYMNKVVCHRRCNVGKGNRTPNEWLADSNPQKFEEMCQQAKTLLKSGSFPFSKYRKLLQKTTELGDFVARQLTDTAYISRATGEYLRCLFEHPYKVIGLKGQLTAELRRHWGLNSILHQDKVLDLKNRDDHRHHAIDALVVALTNRSRLQTLSNSFQDVERIDYDTGEVVYKSVYEGNKLNEPWPRFRVEAQEKIEDIHVSHRAERGVHGALHEESFYGCTDNGSTFVKRKPLDELSPSEIEKIRDPGIQTIVSNAMTAAGLEFGRGKKTDRKQMKTVLSNLSMPSGVPIKKVRLLVNDSTIQPIREGTNHESLVKPGSTHHLAFFQWEEDDEVIRDTIFVTMLDAKNRIKSKQPIIQRVHPQQPNARFLFSLSRGEMILTEIDGFERLLVFNTAAQTSKQMWFHDHRDARKASKKKRWSFMPSTLDARKVNVDMVGRLRWAND